MANVTAIPLLGAHITFDNKAFNIYEGDQISDLVYKDGMVQKTITGMVRVINATSRAYSAGPDECPPESFIKDIVSVNELIIDTSDQYDAEIVRVAMKDIISIGKVNNEDPEEVVVPPSLDMLFVYDEDSWNAAKSAGVPESWMPVYDPMVESCPWMVLFFKRGTQSPMKLSSLVITNGSTTLPVVLNASSEMFDNGVLTMSKDTHMLGLELIVPKVSSEAKDYINQSEAKNNTVYTAYCVANNETTVKVSKIYSGPTVK